MNTISQPIMQKGSIEFCAHQGQAFVFVDGEKMPVADAPVRVHQMIRRDIEHHPGATQALEALNITDPIAQHEQYTMCMHGELNGVPDFINFKPNTDDHEYTSLICGTRNCKYRGVLCQKIHGQYGNFSNREGEILQLLKQGGRPQEIADALGTSIHTVRCQIENMKLKTGIDSLLGLVVFSNK